jgi:Uma2 family endonuclease
MTADHNQLQSRLARQLYAQLDELRFDVRTDFGRVRRSSESYYIPDACVVPVQQVRNQLGTGQLEVFTGPLPLVIEVWSPSTGDYDVETKLPEYQARGDLEIWHVHPIERTLTAWLRQQDGSYVARTYRGGTIQPAALPGVSIDLDALFA